MTPREIAEYCTFGDAPWPPTKENKEPAYARVTKMIEDAIEAAVEEEREACVEIVRHHALEYAFGSDKPAKVFKAIEAEIILRSNK